MGRRSSIYQERKHVKCLTQLCAAEPGRYHGPATGSEYISHFKETDHFHGSGYGGNALMKKCSRLNCLGRKKDGRTHAAMRSSS
jgi:GTP-dependent phosphoenolpyruvate carboxykinase